MKYDPVKNVFARAINWSGELRVAFYKLQNLFFLRERYVKRLIRKYYPEDSEFRFYDAGAGFCQYSWFVLSNWTKSRVFATDLKKDYLESFAKYARPRWHKRFNFQSADLQIFRPKLHYDLAVAVDILEHIPDDLSAMQNIYDCLKDKGLLIISTPSDSDEAAKFTAEHVRPGYNKQELEQKLKNVGFTIKESLYSYGFFGALSWRIMIKKPLQMLQKSRLNFIVLPFYYLVFLPLGLLLMEVDLRLPNPSGTGILVVAEKPVESD